MTGRAWLKATLKRTGNNDLSVVAPGKLVDTVGMPGDPIADVSAAAKVDFVMMGGIVYGDST